MGKLTACAYAIVVSVLVGLLLSVFSAAVDLIVGRRTALASTFTFVLTAITYGLGILALMENLLYTAQGVGLKSNDGFALRILFGLVCVAFGALLALHSTRISALRARRFLVASLVLLVPAGSLVGVDLASTPQPSGPVMRAGATPLNIVVLSSDGVNADHLSVYGYERKTTPFLDSTVGEFQVFENAFTNNGNTTGSITAMLTGVSPLSTKVVYPPDALNRDDSLYNLPNLLGKLGYERYNWAVPHYAEAHSQNLAQSFEEDNGQRLEGSPLSSIPLGAGVSQWFVTETFRESSDLALDLLGIREIDNPFSQVSVIAGNTLSDQERLAGLLGTIRHHRSHYFLNAHFMGTHGPAFEPEVRHFSVGQIQREAWDQDFYDDALLEFDGYVRDVYRELERAGDLDNTILIVTSDHGMEYDATKRIPLLIRWPHGERAGRVTTNVQRLDIAPTVLEAIGVEQPSWMTGSSLTDPSHIPLNRTIFATTAPNREFMNRMGFRESNDGVLVTAVRCRNFINLSPKGEVEEGEIQGSTADCSDHPQVPDQALTDALSAGPS